MLDLKTKTEIGRLPDASVARQTIWATACRCVVIVVLVDVSSFVRTV